jgi:putative FmdB family regulatory protein
LNGEPHIKACAVIDSEWGSDYDDDFDFVEDEELMPTYEYECKKCGHFEHFQRITDEKLKRCPQCKGTVKRLLGSGAGIIFKGTGFYQTDYRSESYQKGAKSDGGGSTTAKKD